MKERGKESSGNILKYWQFKTTAQNVDCHRIMSFLDLLCSLRLKMKLNRRAWKTQTIQRRLGYASEDIKVAQSFERGMKRNYESLNEDIVASRETLEDAKSKVKSRRENTTFQYNYLVANAESIRQDVRKKEMQKDDIKLQIDTIQLSQVLMLN